MLASADRLHRSTRPSAASHPSAHYRKIYSFDLPVHWIVSLAISMCLHRPSSHYLLGVGGDALRRYITLPLGLLSSGRNPTGRESGTELFQSTYERDQRREISLSLLFQGHHHLICGKHDLGPVDGTRATASKTRSVRLESGRFIYQMVSLSLSLPASRSSSLASVFAGGRSMAGLMGVTAFLSMWINNSAATSIMIPAAVAIVDELRTHREEAQRLAVRSERWDKEKVRRDCSNGINR